MKSQNYKFIITTLVLACFSTPSFAGYDNKSPEFYLKHFSTPADLQDSSCKQFLKSLKRGGQPVIDSSNKWLLKLKANGVKQVFDLREEVGNSVQERDILLKNGISYVKLPLRTSGNTQPTEFVVEVATPSADLTSPPTITKTLMNSAQGTIYVLNMMDEMLAKQSTDQSIYLHCQRGEDRTGLMVALLRQCNSYKTEFNNYGGVMYKPLQSLMAEVRKFRK